MAELSVRRILPEVTVHRARPGTRPSAGPGAEERHRACRNLSPDSRLLFDDHRIISSMKDEDQDAETGDAYDIPPLVFTKRVVPTGSILKIAILVLIWALSFR
jgi:hypothetical protein